MDKGRHPQVVRPWKVERTKQLDRRQEQSARRAGNLRAGSGKSGAGAWKGRKRDK